ncbi:MAG: hypothetical protein K6F04_00755 [bacterium]|nr:hypothetical protein [bacterium]
MRKSIYIALFASLILTETTVVNAGRGSKKSVRASTSKRAGTTGAVRRRAASTASVQSGSTSSSSSSSSSSSTTEEKDVNACEQIFYECMNEKTQESLMANEALYTDYEDLISEFYSGMKTPVFKCIYSDDVKALYSKYNYGFELNDSSSRIERIRRNSIYYYMYLKENATEAINKKIIAPQIHKDVLSLAKTDKKTSNQVDPNMWDVSYVILSVQPRRLWQENIAYCTDPAQNKNLSGCPKMRETLVEKWSDKWLEQTPTKKQSCNEYETFLKNNLTKAKAETVKYITGIRSELEGVIDAYNLKTESEKELTLLELKDKETEGLKNLKEQCQKSAYNICKKAVAHENKTLSEADRYNLYKAQCFNLFDADINDCHDPFQFAKVSEETKKETSIAQDVAKLARGELGRLLDPNPIHRVTGLVSNTISAVKIGIKSVKKFFGW